jgi:hypothetical protein
MTAKLNNNWMVQVGLSSGNDVAPWVGEINAKPTFNACVSYTWRKGWDNLPEQNLLAADELSATEKKIYEPLSVQGSRPADDRVETSGLNLSEVLARLSTLERKASCVSRQSNGIR